MTQRTPGSQQSSAELTVRGLILGLAIGTVMTAANTYLGLYAGMTVSASIPAAIVSMGILRGLLRRGTILENNIVQTIASAGESVAAGIIFTVPALVISGVWTDFPYWKVTFIGLLGGVLGVLFMIPLRRTLIVEDKELIYPEGVACAQVLEAGETGGRSLVDIAVALVTGLVFKSLIGLVAVFRSTVEGAVRAGNSVLYFGTDVSVALLGVGVIVGLEVSTLVFLGGAIGWLVGIPIYYLVAPSGTESALDAAWAAWEGQIRYMGVGSMIVGGLWSMWSIRAGMMKGVREAIAGFRAQGGAKERTDEDMPTSYTLAILALSAVATIVLYYSVTGSLSIGLVSGLVMVVACFFFVAVSSYVVGLVGSSNNPISGMTICALMFASVVLLLLGMSGAAGVLGALGVAGVVCCAAATAGDTSQDLKTGYLVGATPRRQQVSQFIGVLLPTFAIAPILTLLHTAYGIGTGGDQALRAPQATLFASIAQALFGQGALPWTMVLIGAGIGIALIVTDEALRRSGSVFRTPVMPVAVGIYLPLSLSVPIFAGGLLNYLLAWRAKPFGPAAVDRSTHRAVLISSGLIAGEAIAGILIAFPRAAGQIEAWIAERFAGSGMAAPVQAALRWMAEQDWPMVVAGFDSDWPTVIALCAVAGVMYWVCRATSAAPDAASRG